MFHNRSFQSVDVVVLKKFYLCDNFDFVAFQRIREANPAGENSSFIFTICVKSVPLYYFKLAYEVLRVAVKQFFETHF